MLINSANISKIISEIWTEIKRIKNSFGQFPRLTTAQRDLQIFIEGTTIYNTTLQKVQTWDGTTWNNHY